MKKLYVVIIVSIFLISFGGCEENPNKQNLSENNISSKNFEIDTDNVSELEIISENSVETHYGNQSVDFTSFSKLNFDDAIINYNFKDTDKVFSLKLDRKSWSKSELVNEFSLAVKNFCGKSVSERNFKYNYFDKNFNLIERQYEDLGDIIDNNFYLLSIENNIYKCAYQNYAGYFSGNMKSEFDMQNICISGYFTAETDREIIEKAKYWSNIIEQDYNSFLNKDIFEMFPFYYETNGNNYFFKYAVKYKNIPFDVNYYTSINSDENLYMANSFAEAYVNADNELCGVTGYYNWQVNEEKEYDNIISFEQACDIINKNISNEVCFNVSRVDLIYKIDEVIDNTTFAQYWQAEPCWKITIDKSGIAEFPRIAFLVNAISGELYTYKIAL